jgi:hypothetical protein
MLKYLAKISMDIFPSVLATIIGAYIVNHYINAKPAADSPAVAVAPADSKKKGATDVANLPAPGVKAKGISEKAVLDKPVAEKPADRAADQSAESKPADAKPTDVKPAETAAAPAMPRGHQPAPREKTIAKITPAPVVAAPAVAAPPADAVATQATQDANDLARAAIDRLRKSPEAAPQEAARAPEAPRVLEAPRIVTAAPPAVRPLPPPITVSTPGPETYGTPAESSAVNPPYTASVRSDEVNRPTPPADIPVPMVAPPLDLRADAAGPMPRARTNVADEMLSGVKSMFHAVLPKAVTPD